MNGEKWIDLELAELRQRGLERKLQPYPEVGAKIRLGDRTLLNFSSNDYLGLARSPSVIAESVKALRKWGSGASASRLLSGTLDCHMELERRLAARKGYPCALLFGSGFLTNIGVIPALLGRNDLAVVDKLAHASIIDAVILSRAGLSRFQHNDVGHLKEILKKKPHAARCLVITESVFSMDGDLAPLREIAAVAEQNGAMLMVDEAHATGVFGAKGTGLIREWHLEDTVHIAMGTLSKALGSYGGFIACSESIRKLCINKARAFIFSTALAPAAIGAALGALNQLETNPRMGAMLLERANRFRKHLKSAGIDTGQSASQIIPLIVGDNQKALSLSSRLKDAGILAVAIRPPTVPVGTARLRFSITLGHSEQDLKQAAAQIVTCAGAEGIV